MSYATMYTDTYKRQLLRWFKRMSNGRGILECEFFGVGDVAVRQNIYHDVVDTSDDDTVGTPNYCFIELNAPLKVVQNLGWYREDESLPILMYLLVMENKVPEKDGKVIVAPSDGFMSGTWEIKDLKAFAQAVPIAYVCNVVPKRNTG